MPNDSIQNTPDGIKLWDEILKAVADAMPEQLFPLFKEVYGKEYPKGTPIRLLSTEHSTFREGQNQPPSSRLADITFLVDGTDYYHIECQMENDGEMVVRMIAYDLHFAMQHATSRDGTCGEVVMRFPRSAVLYPEKNRRIPGSLKCRLVFQDGSEHVYRIPAVRIQSYSLQSILEKHLDLFIPYAILRLSPKLGKKSRKPLTEKELTEFIGEAILVLRKERDAGYLTQRQHDDYIALFRHAADRVLAGHPEFQKEVEEMTKPMIKLPSVRERELEDSIAMLEAQLADRDARTEALLADRVAKMEALFADRVAKMEALLADRDAKTEALLADRDAKTEALLADRDAEIDRLRRLLAQQE